MGYSLPLTDLVTVSLLSETLVERRRPVPVALEFANPDGKTVLEHLQALGIGRDCITPMSSLKEFAQAYERRCAEEFAEHLLCRGVSNEDVDYPVAVGRSREGTFAVEGVERREADADLLLTPYPEGRPFSPVGQPDHAWRSYSPPPLTLRELFARLQGAKRILARCPSGSPTSAVGTVTTQHVPSLGVSGWQVLVTAEEVSR